MSSETQAIIERLKMLQEAVVALNWNITFSSIAIVLILLFVIANLLREIKDKK